jgi:hypothetical protein
MPFPKTIPITEQLQVRVDTGDWYRAAGECICQVCKKEYGHYTHRCIEGFNWLNLLCNGHLVKL